MYNFSLKKLSAANYENNRLPLFARLGTVSIVTSNSFQIYQFHLHFFFYVFSVNGKLPGWALKRLDKKTIMLR